MQWNPVEVSAILPYRELYRQEMHCQIVHDCWCTRGKAACFLACDNNRVLGYGLVDHQYDKQTLYEYYVLPEHRRHALPMLRGLLQVSGAKAIRAQTNDRLLMLMLYDCAAAITSETILFADAITTQIPCPAGLLRKICDAEKPTIFKHHHEPVGDWGIELDGRIVATAGALYHYNPPYGDVYMEVDERFRRQGVGSYLVQEVKRACYQIGQIPAARCSTSNEASRRTLEKAGFLPCARILRGTISW